MKKSWWCVLSSSCVRALSKLNWSPIYPLCSNLVGRRRTLEYITKCIIITWRQVVCTNLGRSGDQFWTFSWTVWLHLICYNASSSIFTTQSSLINPNWNLCFSTVSCKWSSCQTWSMHFSSLWLIKLWILIIIIFFHKSSQIYIHTEPFKLQQRLQQEAICKIPHVRLGFLFEEKMVRMWRKKSIATLTVYLAATNYPGGKKTRAGSNAPGVNLSLSLSIHWCRMYPDKLEEVQRILLRLIDPYLTAFGGWWWWIPPFYYVIVHSSRMGIDAIYMKLYDGMSQLHLFVYRFHNKFWNLPSPV